MNKAQSKARTQKLLFNARHVAVMQAFLDGASVTLQGEHIPAPTWAAPGDYVAFKGGKEVARSTANPVDPFQAVCGPAEEKPLDVQAILKAASPTPACRLTTWNPFQDLGNTLADTLQRDYPQVHGWNWYRPGHPTLDPTKALIGPTRDAYTVILRDGTIHHHLAYSAISFGDIPCMPQAEVIRWRKYETSIAPCHVFTKAESARVFHHPDL